MGILQIMGCGFLTLVLWLILEQYKSSLSIFVVSAFGVLVLLQIADSLEEMIQTILTISVQAGVHTAYLTTMIKMIGIAWLTEFLCQTCRDAGSGALAIKLEFAAKVSILLLIFPVLTELLHYIISIL